MEFALGAELESFRADVRAFIANDLPAGWDGPLDSVDDQMAVERQIMRRLGEKHWLALPWPEDAGGLGASPCSNWCSTRRWPTGASPGP